MAHEIDLEMSIVDQVVDFHDDIFDRIFSTPFRAQVKDRLRRDAVVRQVQDAAGAASQSMTRLFANEQLAGRQVAAILAALRPLVEPLTLDEIASANETPERIVDRALTGVSYPEAVKVSGYDALFRVALHAVVQVLTLVGSVMAEWRKLGFSSTFELPRRVVHRLNLIGEQLGAVSPSGQAASDERYELSYRDYLLQRFYRVEAGTVRMTTNLDVDLRELFVMPRLRTGALREESVEAADVASLMDLAAARQIFGGGEELRSMAQQHGEAEKPRVGDGVAALEQVRGHPRNVIVGPPGSGKSTFFEWLQVKLAAVEEELIMGGQQAIPLLLRVRQLNPRALPRGDALVAAATANADLAALMPAGWLHRQMQEGRVLLMVDGLDETEPESRDGLILPWLSELCGRYLNCRYLVSSRPVGYPPAALRALEFAECQLLDFDDDQVGTYARHWCTAVRLARNEPEEQARREGTTGGDAIVAGFHEHGYIRTLARNPLMLSAICLVNYFESGVLPKDRALLYRLCVEGLLHHWDQRRGIRSEFSLQDKLRACREVALAMQVDDRAEYEATNVRAVFRDVLNDESAADALLEHVRRRSGLLLERRSGAFAFAHLTFQEYLAARAVHEGNRRGIDIPRLAREHRDPRWQEVIPLFCGTATAGAALEMVEALIAVPRSASVSSVLSEAFLSARPDLLRNGKLRRRVIERVSVCSGQLPGGHLSRFHEAEVAPVANGVVGTADLVDNLSEAYGWIQRHPGSADWATLANRLRGWRAMTALQLSELVYLQHSLGPTPLLAELASELYHAPGPDFGGSRRYNSQAEVALLGLLARHGINPENATRLDAALLMSLRIVSVEPSEALLLVIPTGPGDTVDRLPSDATPEFTQLVRHLASQAARKASDSNQLKPASHRLSSWADALEERAERRGPSPKAPSAEGAKRRKRGDKRR